MNEGLVKRRWVLYFSGFDPAGPARYHELFKEQSALAAPLLGAEIAVGERSNRAKDKLAHWQVRHSLKDSPSIAVETDYVFARWDDVVRSHWLPLTSARQVWVFLGAFFATQWLYWRSGAMLHMLRLSILRSIALIAPLLIVLVGLLLIFTMIGSGFMIAVESLFFNRKTSIAVIEYSSFAMFLIVISSVWLIVAWQLEKRWHSLWLLRSFMFTRLQALKQTPDLEARLNQHAQHIRQAAASGLYDEILVVGHSSGCMMASLAMARALPLNAPSSAQMSLLTLGHCWPMLSSLPAAFEERNALAHLSAQAFKWVDISAAADGCCFAFVDPTQGKASNRPQLVSARWHTLFSAVQYKALKLDRFRFHFQYLYATPKLGDCDFFAVTSGPQTLAGRFETIPAVSA